MQERLTDAQKTLRYEGTIVGGAVGDALGAPLEFLSPRDISKKYSGRVTEMVGGGKLFKWREGEVTDDTEQTLCIVDSLIENEAYIPEDIAERFKLWFLGRPKDIGITTYVSLLSLTRGASFRESGEIALYYGSRATNGSLMRTAPLGLYFRGRPDEIDKSATEISTITHAHEDCILACQVASNMIAYLASGFSKEESVKHVRDRYGDQGKLIRRFEDILAGYSQSSRFGEVYGTLFSAMQCFLEEPTFEKAIIRCVNRGWDADTTGSVCGSFAGAYWGIEAIPDRWSGKLNPTSSQELESKADKLFLLNNA